MVCNATCFPGYFGYLCKEQCDCPVDQCDRKYGCRRNAPGGSLRKNMGKIFWSTSFFPFKDYYFLNSCDNAIALVRNEYTCIYIKICTLNLFDYLDKHLIRSKHYNTFSSMLVQITQKAVFLRNSSILSHRARASKIIERVFPQLVKSAICIL